MITLCTVFSCLCIFTVSLCAQFSRVFVYSLYDFVHSFLVSLFIHCMTLCTVFSCLCLFTVWLCAQFSWVFVYSLYDFVHSFLVSLYIHCMTLCTVFSCLCLLLMWLKAFPHTWHVYGLAPVWIFSCIFNAFSVTNGFLQTSQLYLIWNSSNIICEFIPAISLFTNATW